MFLTAAAVPSIGQSLTFKWETELCEMTGTYNSKKVSKRRLTDTVKLMRQYSTLGLDTRATVFKPEDLPSLDLAELDAEYKRKSSEVASLQVIASPYWQRQQQAKLTELKQSYELSRATMRAYTDPRALLEYPGVDQCKTKYARPLVTGGDALLNAWRIVNEDSRKKNADPTRLRKEFEWQLASSDRMKYALVEVMAFGWWNCANESIDYVQYDGSQEREFEKQFKHIRRDCDEP
ncbi:MAG: hypothetical protein UZ17_ACD001002057 [Acidobacteria bacterium OLB17]|nr:MAG: hypothetical protein UZ17_ACD001002057 [Acidobacteria bacterium OLB17]MCZ2389913.1 hypothetical protein [Acidobacteriota bacterium]